MPHCYLPWTHIDISPIGEIRPCCKFRSTKHLEYPLMTNKINDLKIQEYLDSPVLKEVKRDFLQNKWPKGCECCRIEEEHGIESKRIQDSRFIEEHLPEDYQDKGFFTASIAYGNTCNLKCISCNPHSSSKWRQEWKDTTGNDVKANHFYKNSFVDDFYSYSENLVHLVTPGGEPFLSGVKEQKELLNRFIEDGRAKDISLHYNTNGTVFPDDSWIALWKNFKEVNIQLSIDGIESRFEYIRYPGEWATFAKNAEKYIDLTKTTLSNLSITGAITVSAYNIAYLHETILWLDNMGIKHPYLGRVDRPIYFRPTVWRKEGTEFIIEQLKNSDYDLSSFVSLVETEDVSEKYFDLFRYKILRHDIYRNLSFKETFPEMHEFLKD